MSDESDESSYGLLLPFWIDTEGYSDRDREMFVCGVEYVQVAKAIMDGESFDLCIHTENSSRVRMLCGKLGISCEVEPTLDETWMRLQVHR